METKEFIFKTIVLSIISVATIIILVQVSLRSEPIGLDSYEKYKPIGVNNPNADTDAWEDNFDSSYIEPVTGCLFLTHKKNTKYGRVHQ
jgi:hypothetical protein